jgi:haloacetate dehalogenase
MPIPGFERSEIGTGEVTLSVHRAGAGRPLILLHGFPQNHACWAKVAPELAGAFDVIVPDLRGYGQSEAPADDPQHTAYSKRRMGADMVGLMDALGLESAGVLGHDRGARVAYRMAIDHPGRVARVGIVEVVPTGDFWAAWNASERKGERSEASESTRHDVSPTCELRSSDDRSLSARRGTNATARRRDLQRAVCFCASRG